jgi:hypothetical protein
MVYEQRLVDLACSVGIMCPSGMICLNVDSCCSELELSKIQLNMLVLLKTDIMIIISHQKVLCSDGIK